MCRQLFEPRNAVWIGNSMRFCLGSKFGLSALRLRLAKAIEEQMFHPKFLSLIFSQLHILRSGLRNGIKTFAPDMTGDILDFGCGSKPYASFFTNADSYVGVDILNSGHNHEDSKIDVFWDGKQLPFDDEVFDGCVAFEVFEHIFSLDDVLQELFRVLRPGGRLLISIPFVFGEHEAPFDYARYTSFGIRHILTKNGFSVSKIEKTTSERGVLAHVAVGYLAKTFAGRHLIGTLVLIPLIFLTNFWGSRSPRERSLSDSALFLNLIVMASKTQPQ